MLDLMAVARPDAEPEPSQEAPRGTALPQRGCGEVGQTARAGTLHRSRGAGGGGSRCVRRLLDEDVVARAAVEDVLSWAAVEDVVAGAAEQRVVAVAAGDDVVAVATVDLELDRVSGEAGAVNHIVAG